MILLSQDIARSSNLSLDDNLCSVVPCSLSSDHLSSPSAAYNHVKDEKQQRFGSTTECATKLQKYSVLDNQVVHGKQLTTPKINREGMHLPVHREVTSLRTYSVLPSNGTSSEKAYCFDTSFSLGRTDVPMLKPVAQMTNKKGNGDDTPRDMNEFTVAMPTNTSSPFILNPGSRRRFQVSKAFQHDFGMGKDRKQTREDQATTVCPKRKRVRFSETETEIQRRKEPKKSHVALKSRQAPKAARNLGLPTSHLESRTQELKKRLTNSCVRVGRRSMFKNIEFLVTGFFRQREKKLEDLIKNYGGIVLSDIPSPSVNRGQRCKGLKTQAVPVVLCSKKIFDDFYFFRGAGNLCLVQISVSFTSTAQLWNSNKDVWFEWVERSSNMMRRSSMGRKAMEWICFVLKEASTDQMNLVKRWKYKEHMTEHFCTRKFNVHGRYMSILSLKGEGRSVIIIPELALNAGWKDIAAKIERFIHQTPKMNPTAPPRITVDNYPYVKAIKESKWQSNTLREAKVSINNGDISVVEPTGSEDSGLLKRCIVGFFGKEINERPTLADIRRWACASWNKAYGVNMYEMTGNMFLFEFPNRFMAEQIMQGEWSWKKFKLHLEW
uniref:BRCT domain-containing protein n=1 Tax=Nicotiana tabacum TaxID=4097 RepID=A0A1S4A2G5_TOBAC|nr:PREDICTED: uncharacterized protein LOC107793103 [Nicotiana tabacum]